MTLNCDCSGILAELSLTIAGSGVNLAVNIHHNIHFDDFPLMF